MSDEPVQPIHNPHDRFFKQIFSRLETAREFLRTHLPPRVVTFSKWDTLKLRPGSFVDERLAAYSSDLLYSVELEGAPLLLYCLFEHRSTVDPTMPFRLLLYMVRIWEDWLKQAEPGRKPPCIIPIVLHQGAEVWSVSTHFLDWLEVPEALKGDMGPFQPDFEHVLVDLSRMSVEQMGQELVGQVALSFMKAVREGGVEAWLGRFEGALGELARTPDKVGVFRTLMRYWFAVDATEAKGPSTAEQLLGRIENQRVKERVMSIAEELLERGRREARQEAEQRARSIAEELLERGRREARQEAEQRARSIAEELLERGRKELEQRARQEAEQRAGSIAQESAQRGRLEGRIQLCQQMLALPVASAEDLSAKAVRELERVLAELEADLRQHVSR
jgi:Putative transposase, YhgA-like